MRKQSQGLKDVRNPAPLRWKEDFPVCVNKDFFAESDAPRVGSLQARNAIEQTRLACAGRTEQNSDARRKFLRNLQIESLARPPHGIVCEWRLEALPASPHRPGRPHAAIDRVNDGQHDKRNEQKQQRHVVRARVIERLGTIVDVDGHGTRDAGKIPSHH